MPDRVARSAHEPRDPSGARLAAMNALARRDYGYAELVARLERSGFEHTVAVKTVTVLAAEGLQDDRRFADSFVASYARRGKGPLRLRYDLGQRGVAPELVDEALEAAGVDWFALALETRERKFGSDIPGDFKARAKQMRFLSYRGFAAEHIAAALGGA